MNPNSPNTERPTDDPFRDVWMTLRERGVGAAQALAARFDALGVTSLLEADLRASAGTLDAAYRHAWQAADALTRGARYVRLALFADAQGQEAAARHYLDEAARLFPVDEALQWAGWLADCCGERDAALRLVAVSTVRHAHDMDAQCRIAAALEPVGDAGSRAVRRDALLRAWQLAGDTANAAPLALQVVLACRAMGDWSTIEQISTAMLARDATNAEFAWQLANAQWHRFDAAAAVATMRALDRAAPGNADVLAALAYFVAEEARYDEAARLDEAALAIAPQHTDAAVDLAQLELRRGAWETGWPRYEARLARRDREANNVVTLMSTVAPRWRGEPLAGRTLVVYSEQGNGDDIQMMRFIAPLAARVRDEGGQLVLACRRALRGLFSRHYVPCVAIEDGALRRPDFCLPMMSVPLMLNLQPVQVRGVPYLRADEARIAAWRQLIEAATPQRAALQVGLAWRGSPTHRRDAQRSMGLDTLAPLLALAHVVFHPLTPGQTALPAPALCCDLTSHYRDDFEDVAAHLSALDAVVTIDSAPLHLGGALGVPVLAMLDRVSHWCWGTGETQAWYDSVQVFRQTRAGEWGDVLARVIERLSGMGRPHA